MGKIMDDDAKTMSDFKLVENNTIVLMTVKAKPVKPTPPAMEEAKQETTAAPSTNQQPAAATSQPAVSM